MSNRNNRKERKGAILVLSALLMVVLLAMVAFTVDVGYLATTRSELQRSADASALAGAMQLINLTPPGPNSSATAIANIAKARNAAVQYAGLNYVCKSSPVINSGGDVVIGYLSNPSFPSTVMAFNDQNLFNAVQVTVSRTASSNGEAPLFFAAIFGRQSAALSALATAAVLINFSGFQMPSDGSGLGILPFALDKQTSDALVNGSGQDHWSWDAANNRARPGSDGVPEGNLYPQGTGAPGNRGTVDIGSPNNSTADVNRQILNGPNANDLSYLGGEIALNENGVLLLNGDTGISAGVKDNLASIIGQPKMIPVYSTVGGNGNNAQYTIVEFVCVRLLEVQLTGKMSNKTVTIQPATMVVKGGIPSTSGAQTSSGGYSLPYLVR